MIQALDYLSQFAEFEKDLDEDRQAPLHGLRSAAVERFGELGFPTNRDEDWRFTNVAPLAKTPFKLAEATRDNLQLEQVEQLVLDAGKAIWLVFVNGRFAPTLSWLAPMNNGVAANDLPVTYRQAAATHPQLERVSSVRSEYGELGSLALISRFKPEWLQPYLAQFAPFEDQPFIALNTAFLRDGAFVMIAHGLRVEPPIHVLHVSMATQEPAVSHPRNLIIVPRNSQATIIESYVGLGEGSYFTNAVTEIIAGENAIVDHYKLQRESKQAFHIASTHVNQSRSSNFRTHYIGLGGGLVRNEVHLTFDGEGCAATVNGLYMASGKQHMDNFTVIDHAKPHCASHQLYKGILDGQAHGVFNGKIFVRQDAQKTDAKQTNQTLLLSDDAVINTKPQLEIFADDVKCTHGATVGQLDPDAIFYLRARGIDLQSARSLLTFAFANDIIDRIKVEPLRAQLEELLRAAHRTPADEKD